MLRFRQSLTLLLACGMLAMAHAGTVPAERTMHMTLTATPFAASL